MDSRTKEILDRVAKIENWQPPENYSEHLQMVRSNRKQLVPLEEDEENEKRIFADKSTIVIGSFSMPPQLQALRIEQARLSSLLDLYHHKDEAHQLTALKLARVMTLMRIWGEERVDAIPRLALLKKANGRVRFGMGAHWIVFVIL